MPEALGCHCWHDASVALRPSHAADMHLSACRGPEPACHPCQHHTNRAARHLELCHPRQSQSTSSGSVLGEATSHGAWMQEQSGRTQMNKQGTRASDHPQ